MIKNKIISFYSINVLKYYLTILSIDLLFKSKIKVLFYRVVNILKM